MDNADEVRLHIRRLEAALEEERAARQGLEAQMLQKQTYINYLESFVVTIGRKVGVSGHSRETLDGIVRAIDALLSKK